MRQKNKLYCDECGKFVRETTKEEQKLISKNKKEGTRTNLSLICGNCRFRILTGRMPK